MWEYKHLDVGNKITEYIKLVDEMVKEGWNRESTLIDLDGNRTVYFKRWKQIER